jgi:hypothetical protein
VPAIGVARLLDLELVTLSISGGLWKGHEEQ